MNHDFYFSILTKEKQRDLFKEINRIDFFYSNHPYQTNTGCKATKKNRTGRAVSFLSEIQPLIGDRIRIGCYWLLKGMKNEKCWPRS